MDETRFGELRALLIDALEANKRGAATRQLAREQRDGHTGPLRTRSTATTFHVTETPTTGGDGFDFTRAAERRAISSGEHRSRRRRADDAIAAREAIERGKQAAQTLTPAAPAQTLGTPQRRATAARNKDTNRLRACAEHEAAHAVVAQHYGATVREIRIDPSGHGYTRHVHARTAAQTAAITAAGDLWNRELGTVPYLDLGCADLADFERSRSLRNLWQANQTARKILTARRRTVLALADQLMAERHITY